MNSSVAISTGVPSGRRYGLMLGVFAGLLLIAAIWLGVTLATLGLAYGLWRRA